MPACLRTATQVCPGGTTTTNTPATGKPGISGTAQVGQTLTATTSGISDTDGKTKAENGDTGYAYTHQWIRVDGSNETDISGETSSTYTPSSFDVGKTIRVRVSFTDDADNAEDPLTSDATAAVTAACSEVWCATLTVRSLTGGARGCAISQAGKECSSNLTEDGFSHGGTDYAVTGLQVLSNGELRLFINPDLTTATRSLVLLVGAERFAFAHADTRAANSRYWNGSGLNWPSGATVDLKLVEASTIATLSGLELEDGDGAAVALTPGFSSGETSYTALVANTVGRITLTETPGDANAWVDYLDGDGNSLTDLDTGTTGHQVDLDPGENVIQVKVTAEDGVAIRTYTVTVTRAAAGNTAATGKPTISGTPQVGQMLTAGIGTIADAEDLPSTVFPAGYTFQWVQVDSSNNETDVGTDSSTYSPTSLDVGSTIKVEVSFTDGGGNAETVISDATAAVTGVTVVTVDVSIAAEHDRIGAGLEDLVFTLTRQGATTDALEATVTIVQAEVWLGTSDLSHTVTFAAGSATATLTLAAWKFSFDPDTSGDLTATVSGTGIAGGEATVEMVSTAYAPITASYDKSSYTFAENANPADVNIYVVARLDPAYPRAPSRRFQISMTTAGDTATFREDYVPVTWQPYFVYGDFAPDASGFVARKRLQDDDGTYFAVMNDDVYEGDEKFDVQLALGAPYSSELMRFERADGTICETACLIPYPVFITDEEDRPVLSLSAAPASISEADDSGTTNVAENVSVLTVAAASPKTFATGQTVTLTFGGSAVYGTHYGVSPVDADANATGHQVLLPAETPSVEVTVTAVDNATVDGGRTIEVVGSLDGTEFDRASIAVADDERANTAPAFVDGASTDREVAENTEEEGTDIGDRVRATDPENDTLEYSLDGTDAASFDIDRGTGQLQTKTGVDYDHEAKSSYSVTVAVNDGYGGTDTIAVTVGVTDEDEPPLAPAAPGVAKVRGSVTSLKVSWRAPDNAGRPAIAHYDLRYRAGETGGWRNGPQGETGTSATIGNLVQNTEYQVQVRAANAEGDGAWSAPRGGTPGVEEARRGELRLVDDSGPTDGGAGRLEVFFRTEWGTVCDDRFASDFTLYGPDNTSKSDDQIVPNVAPQLACQLMGYSTGEVVSRGELGMTSVLSEPEDGGPRTWLDDVRCAAGSTHWTGKPATKLHHCYHAGVGLENCTHEEDVHLRCVSSSTARAALSGEFQNVPESHDGTEFTFQAAFNEAVTASAEDLRDHAFDVTGGTVTEVSPVDGRRDLWSVTVSPASSEDVTITLDGERACDTPGAVCAEDGEQLTNTVSVEIPGTPVTGDGITARFEDVPPQHDGETPFTLRLALSAPVRNSYTAMREDVLEATGGTVTRARRIDGRSDLWEITITPQGEGNVQIELAAGRACGTRGALCTRDGRALATGLMTLVPGPSTIGPRSPGPAPLTARFTNIPGEHDGESVFTLEIVFSEAPSGMKNKTLRNALRVTNGAITRVRRVNLVLAHRIVTVRPTGHEAVDIELPPSPDCEAAGAICTGAGGRLEAGLLTRVRGPAALSVADVEVHEGPGAVLAFAVTLDRATSAAVSVDYATSDGTAQAGSDYTAASGSVTFAPGEMAKTVSVAVLDDSHDEGSETLTLTLTNPSGAYLEDGTATGTITNTDHMPKAWIARFGRTVGTQVVDALTQRLDGAGGSHVTVAGINLIGAKGEEPTLTGDDPFGLPEWAKNAEREADAQSITGEDLVLRSAFHLSSGGNAMQQGGGAFTAWGRVATAGFKAEEDDVTMDGDVTTGLVGFDAEWERGLAGIMLSQSSGDGSYRLDPAKGEDAGTVESSLTGVYPYARVDLNAKVSVWALAGMGSGELTLRQTGKKPMPTDISMRMGALGVKGQVLDGSGPSGVALNVKSDAMWVGTKSERSGDMIATQGDVMRLRLIIQGERTFEGGSGAAFTPSAEVGLRHDGGDAETGTGVEVGAGLRYSIGSVTIEARARTLLAHEASGYDEWGMSGAIRVTPAASGRGLTLSIAPAWGRTGSAAQRLWSAHDARGLGADNEFEADSRLDMEAGYGFGLPGSRGVLTPHAGMTLGDAGHRAIRTGARWQLSPDAVLGLEGTRQTSDAGEAATEVKLRAALRF